MSNLLPEVRTRTPAVKSRNWSEEFNALPREARIIGAAMESKTRIQHLNFEKDRLKRRYRQSLAEIDEHIKICEAHLLRLEKESEVSK